MFGYFNYDQFNITISYQILEVNYQNPCYFTINFKNSGHEIEEVTDPIYYEGQQDNYDSNHQENFDDLMQQLDKIQRMDVDREFNRRSTKLGLKSRKHSHKRLYLPQMDINHSFSQNFQFYYKIDSTNNQKIYERNKDDNIGTIQIIKHNQAELKNSNEQEIVGEAKLDISNFIGNLFRKFTVLISKDSSRKDLYLTIKTQSIQFEGDDGPNQKEKFDAFIKASIEQKKLQKLQLKAEKQKKQVNFQEQESSEDSSFSSEASLDGFEIRENVNQVINPNLNKQLSMSMNSSSSPLPQQNISFQSASISSNPIQLHNTAFFSQNENDASNQIMFLKKELESTKQSAEISQNQVNILNQRLQLCYEKEQNLNNKVKMLESENTKLRDNEKNLKQEIKKLKQEIEYFGGL